MSFNKNLKGKSLKVQVSVEKIRFDPSDELTKAFKDETMVYEIYQD